MIQKVSKFDCVERTSMMWCAARALSRSIDLVHANSGSDWLDLICHCSLSGVLLVAGTEMNQSLMLISCVAIVEPIVLYFLDLSMWISTQPMLLLYSITSETGDLTCHSWKEP